MFVKTANVMDWRDLQEKVSRLFIEMDYHAEIGKTVELAGRGEKEIDVFVTDPLASYNQTYLIECKYWNKSVPQEVVHSFKTVMEGTGANTGFVISKKGFQSGAYEASRFTNIRLFTFEQLQHLYGDEWFRKQSAKLQIQEARLRIIHKMHFDQNNNLPILNNIYFYTEQLSKDLTRFHRWITDILLCVGPEPTSYLGPEPIRKAFNPMNPSAVQGTWYEFPTVRDYFNEMTLAARQCADNFEESFRQAKKTFECLPDENQSDLYRDAEIMFREELPIRVLKRHVTQEEYQKLLNLVGARTLLADKHDV